MTRSIIGIIVWFSCGIYAYGQDTVAKSLTLEESVKTGVTNATTVLLNKNQVTLGAEQVMQSYAQFLPDLNAGASFGYTSGKSLLIQSAPVLVANKNYGLTYQIVSTLNLFNGLYDRSNMKGAMAGKKATEMSLEWAKHQVAFDVTQTYLQMVLDKQIMDFAKQNLDYSAEREKQLQELTRVGRKAMSDLFQQQAQTSQDRLYYYSAENRWRNDQVLLLRKIKLDVNANYTFVQPAIDSVPLGENYLNEQQMLKSALNQRPDLKSYGFNRTAADWYIKRAKSGYYPKLNMSYGLYGAPKHVNYLALNGTETPITNQPSFGSQFANGQGIFGLTLSWTIFDRFNTRYNVALARYNAESYRINEEDLTMQVSSDIKTAFNNYSTALQQMESARTGLFAATQSYETINGKYQAGAANFIEVVNAQAVLLQARQSKSQADINLMLQKRIIDYIIGNVNY